MSVCNLVNRFIIDKEPQFSWSCEVTAAVYQTKTNIWTSRGIPWAVHCSLGASRRHGTAKLSSSAGLNLITSADRQPAVGSGYGQDMVLCLKRCFPVTQDAGTTLPGGRDDCFSGVPDTLSLVHCHRATLSSVLLSLSRSEIVVL